MGNCLNLPFGTQGRSGRLESFAYTQEMGDPERLACPGDNGVLLGFTLPFSLILLNPEGTSVGQKKRIKFWMERLIINLARVLGFRGTQFYLSLNLSGNKQ